MSPLFLLTLIITIVAYVSVFCVPSSDQNQNYIAWKVEEDFTYDPEITEWDDESEVICPEYAEYPVLTEEEEEEMCAAYNRDEAARYDEENSADPYVEYYGSYSEYLKAIM
jgi:hypothetical protein